VRSDAAARKRQRGGGTPFAPSLDAVASEVDCRACVQQPLPQRLLTGAALADERRRFDLVAVRGKGWDVGRIEEPVARRL